MLTKAQARKAVRLSTDIHDEELSALVTAGVMDLETAGVVEPQEGDPELFDLALRMFVRAHFEPDSPEAPRCMEIYKNLKETMKLCDRYRGELEE